jgi:hypothetical protein
MSNLPHDTQTILYLVVYLHGIYILVIAASFLHRTHKSYNSSIFDANRFEDILLHTMVIDMLGYF